MARSAPQITDRISQERDRFEALSPDQKTVVLQELAGGAGGSKPDVDGPTFFSALARAIVASLAIWVIFARSVGLL